MVVEEIIDLETVQISQSSATKVKSYLLLNDIVSGAVWIIFLRCVPTNLIQRLQPILGQTRL